MSTPQSLIYICSGVKLNNKYEHTVHWDSRTAQQAFFAGKVVRTFSAYTFLRKSWSIKVQASLADARSWNYLYFCNSDGRYWYYFINNVEYVNDSTVELFLELDVMQSYDQYYSLLRCFVERQHTASDAIGANTVDEGLEIGELVTNYSLDIPMGEMCILLLCTIVPNESLGKEEPVKVLGSYYNDIFNGMGIYAIDAADWVALAEILNALDGDGFSDGVISMWMYPKKLVELDGDPDIVMRPVKAIAPFFQDITRPAQLTNGYTPRNNKLYCYPYTMLYATNNAGGAATFRYERFGDPTACNFKITGALSPEGKVRMYPLNYNGEQHAYEHGLNLDGFPTCAWNQDVYKLWLAQNQNQQDLSLALSAVSVVGGVAGAVATGGAGAMLGLGSAISGVQNIASILAQRKDQQIQPPQAKGQASASVNTVAGFQTFTLKRKSPSLENLKILDGFFDMYGYKINAVQVPNRATRENWTYIKTVGCHINGNFAVEDVNKIEEIFDKGITFWKNGDSIGNYSLTNRTL